MKTSYHSHSRWCRHGKGELEEYVLEAIKNNFELMALCEHTPDDNDPMGPRSPWSDYPAYLKEVERLENKYGDQIKLIRSFEAEYYPEMMDQYRKMKEEDNIQIWILGQHESAAHDLNYYHILDFDKEIRQYTDDLLAGIKTGFFDVLAHPDLMMLHQDKPSKLFLECMEELFQACEAYNVIVEINANGIRGHKGYPNKEVFEIAKKYNLKYIVSTDAHDPKDFYDDYVKQAEQFAKDMNITPLDYIVK